MTWTRDYLWVPYREICGRLAQGWRMGNGYLEDTLHHRFAVMMWRET